VVPDVNDTNVLVAIQALRSANLPYLIIEVENGDAEPETVFRQNPSPGTEASPNTVVTLMVAD
jgi:beta-lactam-binding protein with PASTA domain